MIRPQNGFVEKNVGTLNAQSPVDKFKDMFKELEVTGCPRHTLFIKNLDSTFSKSS